MEVSSSMNKFTMTIILIGIVAILFISACSFIASEPISILEVEINPLLATLEQNNDATIVANGANDFAFRFCSILAESTRNESFVVSPYSIWLTLAALINATDDSNRETLIDTLGASGIEVDDINRAVSRMIFGLTDKRYDGKETPIKIANAIFVSNELTVRRNFAQTFMDYYRGTLMNVDFSSPDATNAVNQWAYMHTDGLIRDLVNQFDPNTVAAIANSIHFIDKWDVEFDYNKTDLGTFHSTDGIQIALFMRREGDGQFYFEDDILQATRIGFSTGGGMYILLPKSGDAVELLQNMTAEYFEYIHNNMRLETLRLLLPKFSINTRLSNLEEILIALGIPLFDSTIAPLNEGLIYEDVPLWLSDVMQKALIEVTEQGVVAAAVTLSAMPISGSLPLPPMPLEMICDRPFVFILYQYANDGVAQVIFTGVVNQVRND